MANVEMLKDKIKDSGMTVVAVCEKAGITKKTFYNRLQNPDFTIKEAKSLRDVLNLTDNDMRDIFLA